MGDPKQPDRRTSNNSLPDTDSLRERQELLAGNFWKLYERRCLEKGQRPIKMPEREVDPEIVLAYQMKAAFCKLLLQVLDDDDFVEMGFRGRDERDPESVSDAELLRRFADFNFEEISERDKQFLDGVIEMIALRLKEQATPESERS